MNKEPFMPKGTKVYWKGDLICESNLDCFSGDPLTVDHFTWYIDKPSIGQTIHPGLMLWFALRERQIRNRGNSPKLVDYNEGR